ncbi:MAG: phospholipase D family protein [Rhodobacteraceae bacterium]|nr:phospholipase D family protein [Paracoccaceae bacterium]
MRALRILLWIVAAAALLVVGARLVWPLPSLEGRPASTAIAASEQTRLGRAVLPAMAAHPGLSGILPLIDGRDAFGARVTLARMAEASIDAQYYIWQTDATGYLLLDELRAAAERGVRVRLLVDDNGIPGLDSELAALDALPQMEVRIFNPFVLRAPRLANYGFDFLRLNRRMHNKSFTVDGAATIVGGRNIGDIYFAYGSGAYYVDFDVAAFGQAAADVGRDFDRYWASGSAYPAGLILPAAPGGLDSLAAAVAAARRDPLTEAYAQWVIASDVLGNLTARLQDFDWVPAGLLSDDPAKGLGQAARDSLLIADIADEAATAAASMDLVSAYFVPGPDGAAKLAALARRGARVRILTNAYAATDVPVVHSAYVRYREQLLDAGVELFELKEDVALPGRPSVAFADAVIGSSGSSLHSKTFAVDGSTIFVGSFNFDARSAFLNTEMGLLISDPRLARGLGAYFDSVVPAEAYRVGRDPEGRLGWTFTDERGLETTVTTEPGTTALARGALWLLGLLPIEWML